MAMSCIIHLARSAQRRPLVAKLLDRLPDAHVVDAVDGGIATGDLRTKWVRPGLYQPGYPFPLNAGEIGVFLSHRACWQRFLDSDASTCFVSEDDALLDNDHFPIARELAEANMTPDRVIRFPIVPREQPRMVIAQMGETCLSRPKVVGLSASLQLVGREAAKRLLAATAKFDRPVDTFQQMTWITGVDVLSVWPAGVSTAARDHGGSTIQKKTGLIEKIPRSVKRSAYRAKIARISKGMTQ